MSTLVKNEDEYIIQWIFYHMNLGVDHFIIYDNSNIDNLGIILHDFIKKNIVVLIKWNYSYRFPTGINGQTTQQNHSIYAFQNCKYIGLFDIDEYVNPQIRIDLKSFFDMFIIKNKINIETISGFALSNKFFYNPSNLSTKKYDFLKIISCDIINNYGDRPKMFIIPKNVKSFSVHIVTSGLPMYFINNKIIFFNHYFFLNKENRGLNHTQIVDCSILNYINISSI